MPSPRSKQSFEELYQQLEEKVSLLEQGGLSLDDSLSAYEEAVTYAQRCQQLLDRAELRITRLRETMNDSSGTDPGDGEEEIFVTVYDEENEPEPEP
jgi:exodeoxyribonuclease VII small subunit